jgi:hypothetical protein
MEFWVGQGFIWFQVKTCRVEMGIWVGVEANWIKVKSFGVWDGLLGG